MPASDPQIQLLVSVALQGLAAAKEGMGDVKASLDTTASAAEAARAAWKASLPPPQIRDVFDDMARGAARAGQAATEAARTVKVDYAAIAAESRAAAASIAAMGAASTTSAARTTVAAASTRAATAAATSSAAAAVSKVAAVSTAVDGMAIALSTVPTLERALGLGRLPIINAQVRLLSGALKAVGLTGIEAAGAVAGFALGLAPVAYDAYQLYKIRELNNDTAQSRDDNNAAAIKRLNDLAARAGESGEVRGPNLDQIKSEIRDLEQMSRQVENLIKNGQTTEARALSQHIQTDVGETIKALRDATGPAFATELAQEAQHWQASVELAKVNAEKQREALKESLADELADRTRTEAQKLAKIEDTYGRLRHLVNEEEAAELAANQAAQDRVAAQRAEPANAGNADAQARLDTQRNALATQRTLITQRAVVAANELTQAETRAARAVAPQLTFWQEIRAQMIAAADAAKHIGNQAAQAIGGVMSGALHTVSSNLTGLITRTENWRQAWANIGNEIYSSIINAIIQMGLKYISTQIIMAVAGKSIAAASVASMAPMAAAASAIWAAPAALATIATYGTAAAAAPAEIAAAQAVTLSRSIGGLAEGGLSPGKPTLTWIGERGPELVIPADVTAQYSQPERAAILSGQPLAKASATAADAMRQTAASAAPTRQLFTATHNVANFLDPSELNRHIRSQTEVHVNRLMNKRARTSTARG